MDFNIELVLGVYLHWLAGTLTYGVFYSMIEKPAFLKQVAIYLFCLVGWPAVLGFILWSSRK